MDGGIEDSEDVEGRDSLVCVALVSVGCGSVERDSLLSSISIKAWNWNWSGSSSAAARKGDQPIGDDLGGLTP